MTSCGHQELILIPSPGKKLQCRHCQLTIDEEELAGGHCPECFEAFGIRRRDFEPVGDDEDRTRYRCENCGAVIEA
jgi:predicted RNA-binding Zn-ribbon protein involved in translation (DUF1610 family)